MNTQVIDKLAENEYYHGTTNSKAIQILYEGFRLKKYYSDYGKYGTFKQGIYLTKSLDVAGLFGHGYIFKCRLKKSISILWLNEKYDKKIINYLRREFSKNILTGPISKAIPHKKQLTKNELIQLLNYRYCKASWRTKKDSMKWWNSKSSFRQQLQLHKYDGIGELEDLVGLVIFNPSFVEPMELFELFEGKEIPSKCWPIPSKELSLREMDKKDFIRSIDWLYKEYIEPSLDNNDSLSKEEIKQWKYIRSLQERYCRENGLLQ